MALHNEFGKWGEEVAAGYLQQQGYELLARNWRHEHKEIDIIATKDGVLYFIEVKTRHGVKWNAEDAITPKKRALMWRAMMAWKLEHPSLMPACYSAIAIVSQGEGMQPEIRWHESIWDLK